MYPRLLLAFLLLFSFSVSGQQYWQQEVNYKINVDLNDEAHTLNATEEVEYINNSPQTLTFLYFHLWPNAYKDRSTAFAKQQLVNDETKFHFSPESAKGSITGLDFKVNGQPVKWEYDAKHPDIAKLTLNQPLPPGGRLTVSTPFQVKLPDSFSRLGHVGQAYQITQWYPKPAVYDQNGWHPMPYLDQGEFYSEYGSFDVRITLPANYTVGATGVLQNPEEQARMDSLALATSFITEFNKDDLDFPPSATETKTLHYKQDRIHDFAWFADKRFNVLKSEVVLPHSKRPVTTWLLFTNLEASKWVNSVKDINDAVYYYSLWLGDYPYAHATAVDGALSAGSGMEYPMVTVTQTEAIIHEVGHNWFYGILGSNEREHPWMDEGINTYYETRIKAQRNPYTGMVSSIASSPGLRTFLGVNDMPASGIDAAGFLSGASRGLDQPVTAPSAQFRNYNYGMGVYLKTAYLFKYLESYLGTARFDSAMHTYYRQWQFKHPEPKDLQAVLEKSVGEPLGWFFQELLPSTFIPDAHLKKVTKTADGLQVTVTQTGKQAPPVQVATVDAEGQIIESYWTKPNERTQTITFLAADADAKKVVLDPEYLLPELDRRDNQYKLQGAFPTFEPLKLQPIIGVSQIGKQQIFYAPVAGYNTLDKFMVGAAFYNHLITEHKFNYVVMPMFAFGTTRLTGLADVRYRLPAQGFLRKIELGAQAQRFANYRMVAPRLTLHNRLTNTSTPRQQLSFSYSFIEETGFFTYQAPRISYELNSSNAISGSRLMLDATMLRYDVLRSPFIGEKPPQAIPPQNVAPVRFRVDFEKWLLYREGKEIRLRTFAGFMANNAPDGFFYLDLAGSPDYLKQNVFFNRAELITGGPGSIRQTDRQDGGFRNPVTVASREWMAALNLTADLPVTNFSAYLDLGRVQEIDRIYYGTGLQWTLFNKALAIYLPVAGSNFENNFPSSFKDFTRSIRYTLHLNALNPFKLIDEMQ